MPNSEKPAFPFGWRFGLVVAVVLALTLPVAAQIQHGVLTGTVTDQTGAVVPGAEVKATHIDVGKVYSTTSGPAGVYRLSELPVGRYKIEISAEGFRTAVVADIPVNVGAINRIDVQLEVGARAEVITVEAGVAMIQTETGQLAEQVVGRQIQDLPLNGRNVYALIQLAPGAANALGVSFENGQGTVVNGMRPNFNGFLINGVANRQLSGGASVLPNPDLVQEFQMLTLNTAAQYGNVAGSINNLVTKSGTNELHGSAYWFFRNDALDANEFFRNQGGLTDPALVRFNQFGATGTGRIIKDKLFITGSYEGSRFKTEGSAVPVLLETPEWRAAISAFNAGSVADLIYTDFPPNTVGSAFQTLDQYLANKLPRLGNIWLCPDLAFGRETQLASLIGILASDIGTGVEDGLGLTDYTFDDTDADGDGFLDEFGPDGTPGTADDGIIPNCDTYYGTPGPPLQAGAISRSIPFRNRATAAFFQRSQTYGDLTHGDRASVRLDYSSQNHHWFGELWYYETRDEFGPANNNSGPRGIFNPTVVQAPNFSSSWVWTLSPTVMNDLRVGFSRNKSLIFTDPAAGVPSIAFDDGSSGFGSYSGYPQFFIENVYSYSDMVSVSKGNHNLKMGVDYKDNRENSTFVVGRPSYYFFDHLYFAIDAPYGEAAGTDPGFASGSNLARLDENNRMWQNFEVGMYFQDDWKVTPHLTLNLGLRYDFFDRHKERFGRMTTFVLPPGQSLADQMLNANIPAGDPGCDTDTQIQRVVLAGVCGPGGFAVVRQLGRADRDNFGPRLGVAWDPWGNGKTVIRGGFAISYEGTLYNPLSNSRWNPPFFSFNADYNDLGTGDPLGVGNSTFIVYGPTTCTDPRDPTTCGPRGDAPDWTTAATPNLGSGPGVLDDGNIQGWFPGAPNQAFLTGIVLQDRPILDPWITNYHVGFQHEFLTDFVLEVNYVGTRGRNLFRAQQINRQRGNRLPQDEDPGPDGILADDLTTPTLPGPDGILGTADDIVQDESADNIFTDSIQIIQGEPVVGRGRRRLNPNYGTMRAWFNTTDSWYNSLQVSVRKRMSHGFMFTGNYTWSHSLDTGSGWHSSTTSANGAAAGDGYSLDVAHPGLDKGNSTFDIRHRFVGNWLWDLPFGQNATGAARKLLHGWQWNGLVSTQTGAHWTPYCPSGNSCDYNFDGERNDRPDIGPGGASFNTSTDTWANGWFPDEDPLDVFFAVPCAGCNGNFPRNILEGPGQFNVDMSLFKNTPITEQVSIQFRFEVFNIFNHPNFLMPSSATGANFANQLTSSIFGASAGTLNARNIQFGLKVLW